MSIRKRFSTIFGMAAISMLAVLANAQITEQAAREQASNIVRSQLHFKPDQFLGIQRDEELEQSLASVVARPTWSEFIYRVSQAGDEIKANVVVYHIFTDVDPTYIIAISPVDGSAYRIRGFGLAKSLSEFAKLMTTLRVKVSNPEQAESIADFYRRVNPENHEDLAPMSSLMELKQAAERRCQSVSSFDAGQNAFNLWWDRAKPLYAKLAFGQTVSPHGSSYLVEWIVLSSPSNSNCGGAPLRVRLDVSAEGQVGKPVFSPLAKE